MLIFLFGNIHSAHTQYGYLTVTTPHIGLEVAIDDSAVGNTPISLLKLKAGNHKVAVSNPQKGLWDYDDWTEQIQITDGDTVTVSPKFKSKLIIRSTPFDANVLLNNQYLGTTPLFMDLPTDKTGLLEINKAHYQPYQIEVHDVTASTIDVKLEPIRDVHNSFQKMKLNRERTLKRNKTVMYSLMAVSVCSGFATAYFKNKAEEKYDLYLKAGTPGEMNRYYSDTQKLDNIYSVSFATFEVSFAFSIFYLIRTVEH